MTTALIVCGLFFVCLSGGTVALSESVYRGPASDHFDGTHFFNRNPEARHDFKTFLNWITNRNRGPWQGHLTDNGPRPVLPGGMRIACVPAQHFSGRSMRDSYKTLWAGFVLESPGGPVSFAGDTGIANHFQEIKKRLGPMRLALMPIGAYKPEWFM